MRGAGHQSPSQGNGAREFLRERRGAGRSDGESAHSRPGCSAGVSPRPRSFASPTRPFAEIGRIPRQDRFSSGSRSVPPRGYSSRERRRRAGRRRSGMFTMSENVSRGPGAVEHKDAALAPGDEPVGGGVVPPALVVWPTRAFRACPPPPSGSAAGSPADMSIPVRVRRRRRGPGAGPVPRPRRNSAVRHGGR